ncbi:hypothetical protein ACFE04_027852 [Oxalis oulophora]
MNFFLDLCKWVINGSDEEQRLDGVHARTPNTFASVESIGETSSGQNSSASQHLPSYTATPSPHPKYQPRRRKLPENLSVTYKIPKHIEDLMKKDMVPEILNKPLSQSTYNDYFSTLLYAEDFYINKWAGFRLENVTLELEDAEVYERKQKNRNRKERDKKGHKILVKFKIDSIPEKRPCLLPRDFVFAQSLGSMAKHFEGVVYRVLKNNIVLAEFGGDFHSQHKLNNKYNVSFSFNRDPDCLKRAHQAIESASDSLFKDFIFPSDFTCRESFSPCLLFTCSFNIDQSQRSAVAAILSLNSAPPYLIEDSGASSGFESSRLKLVVLESVVQIYGSRNPSCRILICAPSNKTCDEMIKSLKNKIPESHMFRANAAFREKVDVPEDILPSCRYERVNSRFTCPPLDELLKFQVTFSTLRSSVLLSNVGIPSGHFSHIFLVDASFTTELEALVPLASLANTETAVVITGKNGQCCTWIRSDMSRSKGLKMSYFERLRKRQLYNSKNPKFIKIV